MSATTEMLKTPQVSATFFDDDHEDDLNHAETAGAQKSADLCGGSEQEMPSSEYRAIRLYCLWCCNESPKEVRLCPSTHCPYYHLRFGKRSPLAPRPLKSIRAKCLECSGRPKDVRFCERRECPTWGYRMGHRPKSTRSNKATKHLDVVFHSGQSIETR